VTSPIGTGLTYSINGTTYQTSTTFTGVAANATYSVTVRNAAGCTSPATSAVVSAVPANCGQAAIMPTSATCDDYRSGVSTLQVLQLCYAVRNNKVSNVIPGQFFYFTFITAPSASFCVDVLQTNNRAGFFNFSINQTNQIYLFDPNCTSRAQGAEATTIGNGRICVTNAVAGATYILQVKYDSKSVIGSAYTGSAPIVQYTFESRINGVTQAGSRRSIDLVQGCTTVYARETTSVNSTETKIDVTPTVSAFPNPFKEQLNFRFVSPISGKAVLEVFNLHGQRLGVVFDGNVSAGVQNFARFNNQGVYSGILIYKLSLDGEVLTGKVQSLK
jgi:hypothetical protein